MSQQHNQRLQKHPIKDMHSKIAMIVPFRHSLALQTPIHDLLQLFGTPAI
jgi:hypothetical protein